MVSTFFLNSAENNFEVSFDVWVQSLEIIHIGSSKGIKPSKNFTHKILISDCPNAL